MPSMIPMAGKKFGRLLVTGYRGIRRGRPRWRCHCDCGGKTVVDGAHLRSGAIRSCGCLQRELAADRTRTHGRTGTDEHRIWRGMITRCENPKRANFKDYGGRGIKVCARWHSFEAFFADMGKRPGSEYSIERIDGNGNYEPSNCRWATPKDQHRNTRATRRVVFRGRSMSLAEAAELAGLNYCTVHSRITKSGWTTERALTERAA